MFSGLRTCLPTQWEAHHEGTLVLRRRWLRFTCVNSGKFGDVRPWLLSLSRSLPKMAPGFLLRLCLLLPDENRLISSLAVCVFMKEQPCSFTQELLGGGDRLVACASPRRQEEGERTERGRRGFPGTRSARSRVLTRTSAPYLSYTLASTFLDFFLDAVRRENVSWQRFLGEDGMP